jgi:TRAP-type mannitol/chloroaromatic compound transport system substrate-binding protein
MKRRKFLAGASLAAGATAAPAIARAENKKFRWKLQSANPAGTPNIELLQKLAADIEKMSDGRLKIEVLPSGAIVNPFEELDAVNKGVVECAQWWSDYAFGKHPAGSLFGAPLGGSGSGLDQMAHLAWYMRGGGRALYVEFYQKVLKTEVVPFLYSADGPECLGWFKKPLTSVDDLLKSRYRISSGLATDVIRDMGGVPVNMPGQELLPAAQKGIVDAIEWINPANDLKVGLYDIFKYYSLQGLHQAIGIADLFFNGEKWRSLGPDLQAIVETAATGSLMNSLLYFIQANAQALKELTGKHGVTLFPAPPDYAPAFIKSAKRVLAKFEEKDPFFKKVLDSQREFAKLVVPYTRETAKLSTLIAGAAEMKS